MNRSRKIMKKLTAAAAASALVLSGTSQVFAASYKETEKAALDKLVAGFSAYWDAVMAQYEKGQETGQWYLGKQEQHLIKFYAK